jgi:hypothetical protein
MEFTMDNRSLPIASGLGGAAILALVLGPWGPSTDTAPSVHPANPGNAAAAHGANKDPSEPVYALSENDQGPWYALCKVFATIDPEDTQRTSNHRVLPRAGLAIHPAPTNYSLGKKGVTTEGEIKEETVTLGKIQLKFDPEYHEHADLSSCLPKFPEVRITFLIATVPDPLGSHLALQFDRDVVALERAAESEGFGFERYWFPWSQILKPDETGYGTAYTLKERLKEQPGILIFRKFDKDIGPPDSGASTAAEDIYSPRLVVFLVGENPTAGLNKIAFTKAVRYIEELEQRNARRPAPLKRSAKRDNEPRLPDCKNLPRMAVLGPLFSASFSPLYRSLFDLRHGNSSLAVCATILSPTTTVESIRDHFGRELSEEHLGEFEYLSPPDDRTEQTMLDYLGSLGYKSPEIASLGEDETPYGNAITMGDARSSTHDIANGVIVRGGPHQVAALKMHQVSSSETPLASHTADGADGRPISVTTHLVYPRDLSYLRNTWEATSPNITPADISGSAVKSRIVPFSLHEQASTDLDSPADFATEQAAPDIDQALLNLTTIIRHRRIRALIVTATNPLDEAYLLQYFRQNTPDVRLATYDQDSLMLRATQFANLRGTISVTSFPLDDNLRVKCGDSSKGSPITTDFPNSAAEAEYIGASILFDPKSRQAFSDIGSVKLLPSTYILGDDVFWPAAGKNPEYWFIRDTKMVTPWAWSILLCALLAFVGFHLYHFRELYLQNFHGSRWPDKLMQDYFLFMGHNQLVTLLFFVALPSLATIGALVGNIPKALVSAEVLAFIVMLAVGVSLGIRIIKEIRHMARHPYSAARSFIRMRDVALVLGFSLLTMGMWFVVSGTNIADLFSPIISNAATTNISYISSRTIALLDGLSPLPIAAAVIVVWYFFALIGLSAARTMKHMRVSAILSKSDGGRDSAWSTALAESQQALQTEVDKIVGINLRECFIFGAGFSVMIALQGWPAMRGVDIALFRDWLFWGGIGLLAITLVSQFSRIWRIWKCLESLLRILEASPLASGFDRLPNKLTSVKIWRLCDSWRSEPLQVHALTLLRQTVSLAPPEEWAILNPPLEALQRHVDKFLYSKPSARRDHVVLNVARDSAFSLSIVDTQNEPKSGVSAPSLHGCAGKSWFQREWQVGNPLLIEYTALRYVALIKYVNAQMRWLLLFVLYGYLFLILGLKTYPFQGQHSISSIITIVVIIIFSWAAVIFIQMDSNPLLSRLEHTTPGKADYFEAGQRLLAIGGIPLIAILASQFPAIERFLLSWVKPALDSIH